MKKGYCDVWRCGQKCVGFLCMFFKGLKRRKQKTAPVYSISHFLDIDKTVMLISQHLLDVSITTLHQFCVSFLKNFKNGLLIVKW